MHAHLCLNKNSYFTCDNGHQFHHPLICPSPIIRCLMRSMDNHTVAPLVVECAGTIGDGEVFLLCGVSNSCRDHSRRQVLQYTLERQGAVGDTGEEWVVVGVVGVVEAQVIVVWVFVLVVAIALAVVVGE